MHSGEYFNRMMFPHPLGLFHENPLLSRSKERTISKLSWMLFGRVMTPVKPKIIAEMKEQKDDWQ